MSWRILLAIIATSACDYYDDHRGDPPEYDAPPAKAIDCTDARAAVIKISSYPIFDPVTVDVEVHGTLSDTSIVSSISLGAYPGARDIAASPGANWSTVVPLTLLLEPNQGPGTVSIHATAVTACNRDGAAIELTAISKPFRVDFAPRPVDAGVDIAVDAGVDGSNAGPTF